MKKFYTITGVKYNGPELEEFVILNVAEEMTETLSYLIFNEGSVVRTITEQPEGFIK